MPASQLAIQPVVPAQVVAPSVRGRGRSIGK